MSRLSKWSIISGIFIIILKVILGLVQINFLPIPGQIGKMTALAYWYMDNLDMEPDTALALDFSNSTAPWISGILIAFGLFLIIFKTLFLKGTDGPNRFGEDPLGRESGNCETPAYTQDVPLQPQTESLLNNNEFSPLASSGQPGDAIGVRSSSMQFKNCSHCSTSGVLPMPGNICPNCKKQLDAS
jgi:uncharacterized membrane protein YhaH (DUF805 family)